MRQKKTLKLKSMSRLDVLLKLIQQYLFYDQGDVILHEQFGFRFIKQVLDGWTRSVEFVLKIEVADRFMSEVTYHQVTFSSGEKLPSGSALDIGVKRFFARPGMCFEELIDPFTQP